MNSGFRILILYSLAQFVNYVHSAHNILIAVTCPSIYALFLATMLLKRRTFGASGGTFSALMNNVSLLLHFLIE